MEAWRVSWRAIGYDCTLNQNNVFWINYTGRRDEYPLPDGMMNLGRLDMTQPKLTANKGAAEVRSKILRKMRQLEDYYVTPDCWGELKTYIKGMAKRASAKKGGLGSK